MPRNLWKKDGEILYALRSGSIRIYQSHKTNNSGVRKQGAEYMRKIRLI